MFGIDAEKLKMNEKEKSKILVVEDENDIRQLMSLHLHRNNYTTQEAVDGSQAYQFLETAVFDLVILDWMLPGMNGLELLRWIREKNKENQDVPILFVTAKSEPENIVKALESGSDDYIVKPFDLRVLMARVHSLLRRREMKSLFDSKNNSDAPLKIGDLTLDRSAHKVFIRGLEVFLTLSEFLLLEALLKHQGKVLSRRQLINAVQGESTNVTGRTIDTHTSVLRKKMKEYGRLIETVRGIGYRIGCIK